MPEAKEPKAAAKPDTVETFLERRKAQTSRQIEGVLSKLKRAEQLQRVAQEKITKCNADLDALRDTKLSAARQA